MTNSNNHAAQINKAILARRVPHGNFKEAFDRGKELFELIDYGMPGSGIMLYGKSGVGKSALTKALVEFGVKHYGEDSVMRTQLTTGATIKGLLASILMGFGDPLSHIGSAQDLTVRLKSTINTRKCKLIIIDEFQHLIPGGNPSRALIDNILNALKILDETDVSFFLSGMEEILNLWTADEQIRSRFQTTYVLDALVYPEDKKTWKGIIHKFKESIEEHGMTINCPDFEDRCYAATKGVMRPLVLILTTAVTIAYKSGNKIINHEHFDSATKKQIDIRDGSTDAFDIDIETIRKFNKTAHSSLQTAPVKRNLSDLLAT